MAGSGTAHLRPADQTLLRIEDLVVEFPVGRTGLKVHAVTNVSIDVLPGETLGLVGESGCGKSTMGKAVMQLVTAQSGTVTFEGNDLTHLRGELLRALRPKLQMIFQDPISSLNPRRRVRDIVREGLDIWKLGDKASRAARVNEVLDTVGIDPAVAGPKRPHEFSGGQCQRISIARAVATEPKLIICDEPVSALDVSVQAQILNLLEEMKRKYGLTLIFIAHDLAVVKNVSDRVAVMYLGKLCEFAQPDELYASPAHPYTAALLSAIPEPDPDSDVAARAGVGGEIPSPLSPPSGCRFRTRCPNAQDRCASEEPLMREVRPGHFVACHFPLTEVASAAPTPATVEQPQAPPPPVGAPVSDAAPVAPAAVPPPVVPVTANPTAFVPAPEPSIEPPRVAPPIAGAAAGIALGAAALRRDDEPAEPGPSAADGGWIAPSPVSPTAPPLDDPPAVATPEPDDAWLRTPATTGDQPPRPVVDWTPVADPPPPAASPPPPPVAVPLPPPPVVSAPPPPVAVPTPPPPVAAPAPPPPVAAPAPPPRVADAPAPPPPVGAPAPAPAPRVADAPAPADEKLAPPPTRKERGAIPDIASLDTLLPDRSKGGSINPRR